MLSVARVKTLGLKECVELESSRVGDMISLLTSIILTQSSLPESSLDFHLSQCHAVLK